MDFITIIQSNDLLLPISAGAAAIVFVISFLIMRNARRTKNVKSYSILYNGLCDLNKRYRFHTEIAKRYKVTHSFNSRRSFENADTNQICTYELSEDPQVVYYYNLLTENRMMYENYINESNSIAVTPEEIIKRSGVSWQKFLTTEERLFEKTLLKPVMDISIKVKLDYTSPKGRVHLTRKAICDYNYLAHVFNEVSRKEALKTKAKIERAKMSSALRYDVLKRDGFRCTICGATTDDGVKLHVDHIMPVAKGGRTEMSNLRTLCDRCNLGKKDKFDEYGLN